MVNLLFVSFLTKLAIPWENLVKSDILDDWGFDRVIDLRLFSSVTISWFIPMSRILSIFETIAVSFEFDVSVWSSIGQISVFF